MKRNIGYDAAVVYCSVRFFGAIRRYFPGFRCTFGKDNGIKVHYVPDRSAFEAIYVQSVCVPIQSETAVISIIWE